MKIIVWGATSGIAEGCIRLWASQGHELMLVARDSHKLETLTQDLRLRFDNSKIHTLKADLEAVEMHSQLWEQAVQPWSQNWDRVLLCYGVLGSEDTAQENYVELHKLFLSNALSQMSLLQEAEKRANEKQEILVVTSVAGDRGRASNYAYGSSKAAMIAFVSGFRAKMSRKNVHVMDIRPGFVRTPMTAHLPSQGPLWANPDQVAKAIDKGIRKKKNILYVPFFWFWIMLIIRGIPEFIFKKLKF